MPENNNPQLNIFKFGGSCFKDDESFAQSLKIVKHYKNDSMVVVCSALFGITNQLLEFGNSVYAPGGVENISETFLKKIEDKHRVFIDALIDNDSPLHGELVSFIAKKIDDLRNYKPELERNGMSNMNSDFVLSHGERMSAILYAEYLRAQGFDAEFVEADDEFIITNDDFTNALPLLPECTKNIQGKITPLLQAKKIVVVPGFYGSTPDGKVTTLGRGGTDFTTTIVAYAVAEDFKTSVIFWKDVDGILSANPKYVPKARLLKQVSYSEAKELAFFGTKILHPKCLKTAEQKDVVVEIRNFTNPFIDNYTKITNKSITPKKSNEIIKGITSLDEITMVTVESDAMISLPGSAAKIFSLMGQYKLNMNFISQSSSENNITFGMTPDHGKKAKQILTKNKYFGKHWFNVKTEDDCALLSVVGAGMAHKPGVAGLLFTTLGNAGINIRAISQGSSEQNITLVVNHEDIRRAIIVIYDSFIDGNIPDKISQW